MSRSDENISHTYGAVVHHLDSVGVGGWLVSSIPGEEADNESNQEILL